MDPLRVGLVGYGRFGKLHAQALAKVSGAELKAICVGSKASAEEAKSSGAEVFLDYAEFLRKGGFDAVDIVSPNYLHARQATAAAAKGLHVLLEKPVATDLTEAKALVPAIAKSGVVAEVGLQYRYDPFWKEFKKVIGSGMVSSPTFAKIESWRGPFRQGSGGWRYDGARVGHQLLEQGVHYFDLAVWFFGMPARVSGFTDSPGTWKDGTYGTAVTVLDYRGGMKLLLVDTLNGHIGSVTASVTGGGAVMGVIQGGLDGSSTCWVRAMGKDGAFSSAEPQPLEELEGVRLEIEDFVKAVRDGSRPPVGIEDGYKAAALDMAAIRAIGEGKPVEVEKFLG